MGDPADPAERLVQGIHRRVSDHVDLGPIPNGRRLTALGASSPAPDNLLYAPQRTPTDPRAQGRTLIFL